MGYKPAILIVMVKKKFTQLISTQTVILWMEKVMEENLQKKGWDESVQ